MAALARRYGLALFELALEDGGTGSFRAGAVLALSVLSDPETERVVLHPKIPGEEKKELLARAFGDKIPVELVSFFRLTIDKGRAAYLVAGLEDFIRRMDAHMGNILARVVSARPLEERQLSRIKELMEARLGKKVEILAEVDPAVIGGFYIHADGYLFDNTIRKRLADIKTSLQRGVASDLTS